MVKAALVAVLQKWDISIVLHQKHWTVCRIDQCL
jgi:hypothetical protein